LNIEKKYFFFFLINENHNKHLDFFRIENVFFFLFLF